AATVAARLSGGLGGAVRPLLPHRAQREHSFGAWGQHRRVSAAVLPRAAALAGGGRGRPLPVPRFPGAKKPGTAVDRKRTRAKAAAPEGLRRPFETVAQTAWRQPPRAGRPLR